MSQARAWVTGEHTYQGFPLFLRRPINVDTPDNRRRFPKLAVLSHEFTKRLNDGRPDPDYNDTLADFDLAVISMFDEPQQGTPLLVETFGGFRHYYFGVAADTDLARSFAPLVARFPAEKIRWEFRRTAAWEFLGKYAQSCGSEASPPVSFASH